MCGLVEAFVVVDAEGLAALADGGAGARRLRREEARRDGGHDDEAREIVEVGDIGAEREAGDFGVMPVDGKGDGRVAEHAEVEGVVRVLPDVLAADDEVLAEGLLEAGVELIAKAGLRGFRRRRVCRGAAERGRGWCSLGWRERGFR